MKKLLLALLLCPLFSQAQTVDTTSWIIRPDGVTTVFKVPIPVYLYTDPRGCQLQQYEQPSAYPAYPAISHTAFVAGSGMDTMLVTMCDANYAPTLQPLQCYCGRGSAGVQISIKCAYSHY